MNRVARTAGWVVFAGLGACVGACTRLEPVGGSDARDDASVAPDGTDEADVTMPPADRTVDAADASDTTPSEPDSSVEDARDTGIGSESAALDAAPDTSWDAAPDGLAEAAADAAPDAVPESGPDATRDAEPADAAPDAQPDAESAVPRGPAVETLVPWGARWRYRDDNVLPPANWGTAAYSDTTWRAGSARLGYGGDGELTAVGYGPDAANKYVTTWFRRTFEIADPANVTMVRLRMLRDDGIRIALNGAEVFRVNLPDGPLTASTLATGTISDAAEHTWVEAYIDPSRLVAGTNVLSAEVHQSSVSSSDLAFDLEMTVARIGPRDTAHVDPVFVGAGDIARCGVDEDEATATLLDGVAGPVFTLGDNVYENGTAAEFQDCYDPTWGRHRWRTHPSAGNHDYNTWNATAYYDYFGREAGSASQGWYSFDLGTWHVVVLNGNCGAVGGCGAGSPQEQWLRADLLNRTNRCTLAYWHQPRFSSGEHGSNTAYQALWQALDDHGVDLVLEGHDHDYERFAPLRADGTRDDTRGIRSFVVGTGGTYLRSFAATLAPNSESRSSDTHGVLALTLRPDRYDWVFLPIAGRTFTDRGTGMCH